MGAKTGIDCKLNYKVGGVESGGAWTELTIARDVTLNAPHGEADATTRGGGGAKATEPTVMDASVDCEIVYDPENAGYEALHDAKVAREHIGIQAFDDEGRGLQANMKIFEFSQPQEMEGVVMCTLTLKPCYSPDNPPEWIEP